MFGDWKRTGLETHCWGRKFGDWKRTAGDVSLGMGKALLEMQVWGWETHGWGSMFGNWKCTGWETHCWGYKFGDPSVEMGNALQGM